MKRVPMPTTALFLACTQYMSIPMLAMVFSDSARITLPQQHVASPPRAFVPVLRP